MRLRSWAMFAKLISAGGLGTYVGAAAAGLVAVLTGQVFAPGSAWPAAVPGLAVLGIVLGAVVARLSRRWLFPQIPRRGKGLLGFLGAGLVTLPLAVAIGQFHQLRGVGLPLIAVGTLAMVVVYLRASQHPSRPWGAARGYRPIVR